MTVFPPPLSLMQLSTFANETELVANSKVARLPRIKCFVLRGFMND
jgi:hypothetical protein